MRVMVADARARSRLRLARTLDRAGCGVVSTPIGRTVLQLCRSSPPDLVLVGPLLIDVTGVQLIQTLRSLPETELIPLIYVHDRHLDPFGPVRPPEVVVSAPVDPREVVGLVLRAWEARPRTAP